MSSQSTFSTAGQTLALATVITMAASYLVLLPDVGHIGPTAYAVLASVSWAILAVLVLFESLMTLLFARLPLWAVRFVAIGILVVFPLVVGLIDQSDVSSRFKSTVPYYMCATGMGLAIWTYKVTRTAHQVSLMVIGALGWYGLYWGCDIFAAIRPGTAKLHYWLYICGWVATVGLTSLLPRRFNRSPWWFWLLICGGSALLIFADRHFLTDLYLPIHIWVYGWALLAMDTALRQLLLRRTISTRLAKQTRKTWAVAGLALTLMVSTGPLAWQLISDPIKRSELEASPLGGNLLECLSDYLPDPPEAKIDASAVKLPEPVQQDSASPAVTFTPRYNILLITIDSLRPDSILKQNGKFAPNLYRLAQNGYWFSHAYAQGSRTAIGMSTLMLGKYSAEIDWRLMAYVNGRLFDPSVPSKELAKTLAGRHVYTTIPQWPAEGTLAERLKEAGYYTVAAPYAGRNHFFKKGIGFERGFDEFADLTTVRWASRSSRRLTQVAKKQIKNAMGQDKPWFSWIHYYDPHDWRRGRKHYDSLLHYTDRSIGSLLRWLNKYAASENTIIAMVSDHGEAFGEHGHTRHATSLFEEQVKVPMILYVPGMPGGTIHIPVAAIDLTRTLAGLAGAKTDKLSGYDLTVDLLAGQQPIRGPVFTELHRYTSARRRRTKDLKAMIDYPWKLILDRRKKTLKLYNLDTDPNELKNRVRKNPKLAQKLSKQLRSFLRKRSKKHPLP